VITTGSALLFGLLCAGLAALFVSLAWTRVVEELRDDANELAHALTDEIAAHAATRHAHVACLEDCRRHGINGAARSKSQLTNAHSMPGPTLRRVK
jgi:hypothetical protein